MGPLLDGLRQLGVVVEATALPFTLTPPDLLGDEAAIDASASSQFVSGLLLIPGPACRAACGSRTPASGCRLPHIQMTVEMLRTRGVVVDQPDERAWVVAPGPIAALDVTIEPDLTNASVFLAAAPRPAAGSPCRAGRPAASSRAPCSSTSPSAWARLVERGPGSVTVSSPISSYSSRNMACSGVSPSSTPP